MIIPKDLDTQIQNAINTFWAKRENQTQNQATKGTHDQGNRSAVTGGKQLDGIVNLLKDLLILNGVNDSDIYTNSNLELPGYYRANKKWDLLVVHNNKLIVAIELKSQVGPSFGNNFNNRTEEAMGSALDIWTAYREGAFGKSEPWVGYLMLLEDCSGSTSIVSTRSPHFKTFKEFNNTSYKDRYRIFCTKLKLERQYNSTCFMTTSKDAKYDCPDEELSIQAFVKSMLAQIEAQYK